MRKIATFAVAALLAASVAGAAPKTFKPARTVSRVPAVRVVPAEPKIAPAPVVVPAPTAKEAAADAAAILRQWADGARMTALACINEPTLHQYYLGRAEALEAAVILVEEAAR